MNRIKTSLSAKIFIGIALILLAVSLTMFGMLRIFMPKTYESEITAQVTANLKNLLREIETAPRAQWESMLLRFSAANNLSVSIFDDSGEKVVGSNYGVYTESDDFADMPDELAEINVRSHSSIFFSESFEYSGKPYFITAQMGTEAVEQVTGIFAKVFPYVFIIIIAISAIAAFLYSRFLAKPIVDISNVSKKLTELNMSWRCDVSRSDEIGTLAANLNEMAVKLDSTMKELQAANEKLQADIEKEREQERRRRDFFSAISHELKTPVTILKGELDGMILNVGKFKDRDKYLQEAYETTESIEKLVQEIMTLAQLDTLRLNFEEVKLGDLADDCIKIYDALAQSKHIQVKCRYEGDATVSADKGQLRTVLSNVIGNAVKHSPEKSVVDVRASRKGGKVVLAVENAGVHIDAAELPQIWEPFYRTDKSRSRDTGGSGLGLYIVKTILDLHGLEYRFENTDEGMRFTILFHG